MAKNQKITVYRRKTREVLIGDVGVGGDNPIRIQSMTNTDPYDVNKTVKQIISLYKSGSELVRLTIPDDQAALKLKIIKEKLLLKNIHVPLVADIHFSVSSAIIAANYVEKIRINPGNFAVGDISKIKLSFIPFLKVLKAKNRALRIGVNHGSLSKRILTKYGNTPKGMVKSAIKYLQIAEENSFFNTIVSMKSSIPEVMIDAYKNLVFEMDQSGMRYPLHLGVTEAGSGRIGRVKSAFGIGSLLLEGIGDTIRVSLTEPPENEIPVALNLIKKVRCFKRDFTLNKIKFIHNELSCKLCESDNNFGDYIVFNENYPLVGVQLNGINSQTLNSFGLKKNGKKYLFPERICDFIITSNVHQGKLKNIFKSVNIVSQKQIKNDFLVFNLNKTSKIEINRNTPKKNGIIIRCSSKLFYLKVNNFLQTLHKHKIDKKIIIHYYSNLNTDVNLIKISAEIGKILNEWKIAGIIIHSSKQSIKDDVDLTYDILQATRKRITQTEFISCPTCGRTQFDLLKTIKEVKSKTSHLVGLKIAIMGCIVNGPGEMADADYGYIGNKSGYVTLFKGKTIKGKNIPANLALNYLIQIIKDDNRWIDP